MSDFNIQHKFFEIEYAINQKGREKLDKEVVNTYDSCLFVKTKEIN